MRINAKLGEINQVVTALKKYRDRLPERMKEVSEEVSLEAMKEAQIAFNNLQDYKGNKVPNDVFVTVEETEKGHKIVATGEDVLFAEYGSGTYNDENHPYEYRDGMIRGQYGKKQGNKPFWVLPKGVTGFEHTTSDGKVIENVSYGNQPARGLYLAEKYIKANINKVAKNELSKGGN